MAGNAGGFEDDPLATESYSQLLFGDHDQISDDGAFGFTISSFSSHNNNTQKMLCFGDYEKQPIVKTGHNSEPACKDFTSLPISNVQKKKKRKGPGIQKAGSHPGAPNGTQRNLKNPNSDETSTVGLGGRAKGVRKEKLGDRITALQQLVSPFGKTDTASVLHEALGYIGFLQDQVHVLCSPYLQRCPTSSVEPRQHLVVDDDGENKKRKNDDLRSRGLCLVPMELTLHVADSNGADLWSSVAMVDR